MKRQYHHLRGLLSIGNLWKHRFLSALREDLNKKITLTKKFLLVVLRYLKNRKKTLYVGFSGGKDSLVLLHILSKFKNNFNIIPFFIEISGNTHEKNIEYSKKILSTLDFRKYLWLRVPRDFFADIATWGFPSWKRRWCMSIYKRQTLIKAIGEFEAVAVGDRIFDSTRRKQLILKRGIVEINKYWMQITIHPIAHFSINDVMEYIRKNGLKLNPLYEEIGGSGNCVYCPFNTNPEYYRRLKERYPEWFNKILIAEKSQRKLKAAFYERNRPVRLLEVISKLST